MTELKVCLKIYSLNLKHMIAHKHSSPQEWETWVGKTIRKTKLKWKHTFLLAQHQSKPLKEQIMFQKRPITPTWFLRSRASQLHPVVEKNSTKAQNAGQQHQEQQKWIEEWKKKNKKQNNERWKTPVFFGHSEEKLVYRNNTNVEIGCQVTLITNWFWKYGFFCFCFWTSIKKIYFITRMWRAEQDSLHKPTVKLK